MRWIHLCGAACIASLLPSGASAGVIFDQSIDLGSGTISFTNGEQAADDFKLLSGASTITDIHWWGFDCCDDPTEPDDPLGDFFTIRIFGDISGTPEIDPLYELNFLAFNRVDTGVDLGSDASNVFAYSVEISPLTLAANTTYWLSISNGAAHFPNKYWNWSSDFVGNSVAREDGPWFAAGGSLGFQLTDDALAVPEPATWALFAAGLAGLSLMNRRRKVA